MSRDVPLWARTIGSVLVIVASWWVVHTDGVTAVMGSSIGIVAIGVVAVSIVRGLGAPLGVWPAGDYRRRYLPWAVIVTALVFAVPIGMAGVDEWPAIASLVDGALWLSIIVGVVTWGYIVAVVPQRSFIGWYLAACLLAMVPVVAEVVFGTVQGGCLVGAVDAVEACGVGAVRAALLFVPAWIASALVTVELGFRRLLIGDPTRSGALVVAGAAGVTGLWGWVVGPAIPTVGADALTFGAVALVAGCVFVLSRSLLVSAVFTGTALGTGLSIEVTRAQAEALGQSSLLSAPWIWHATIGGGLLLWVGRHRGWIGDTT